eukprot:5008550-Pyramimonas_sp.AAC.1
MMMMMMTMMMMMMMMMMICSSRWQKRCANGRVKERLNSSWKATGSPIWNMHRLRTDFRRLSSATSGCGHVLTPHIAHLGLWRRCRWPPKRRTNGVGHPSCPGRFRPVGRHHQ